MENNFPTCRVCMQKSPEFVDFDMPLQNENEEDTSISYLDFFCECTRIEVEPHEGGSQCFCLPCGEELRSFYKFIKIAEMTDGLLRRKHMAKGKCPEQSDSMFEKIIAYEPDSEDESTPEELFFSESFQLNTKDHEGNSGKDQMIGLNCQSDGNDNISRQKLLDFNVEVYENNNFSKEFSLISDEAKKSTFESQTSRTDTKNTLFVKGPVECAFCHEILKNRKRLDTHLVEEHQRRSQPCQICGKMVIRMRDHMLIHYRQNNNMSRPKVECPICLRKVSKQTISRHIRFVHKKENKTQKCQQCLQTFADAHKLKIHQAKGHATEVKFKCPLCCRTFSNGISLNNHLRVHSCLQPKSLQKMFSCVKCPLYFHTKKLLERHNTAHAAEGFDCEICGKKFDGVKSLRRHLQSHISAAI